MLSRFIHTIGVNLSRVAMIHLMMIHLIVLPHVPPFPNSERRTDSGRISIVYFGGWNAIAMVRPTSMLREQIYIWTYNDLFISLVFPIPQNKTPCFSFHRRTISEF